MRKVEPLERQHATRVSWLPPNRRPTSGKTGGVCFEELRDRNHVAIDLRAACAISAYTQFRGKLAAPVRWPFHSQVDQLSFGPIRATLFFTI